MILGSLVKHIFLTAAVFTIITASNLAFSADTISDTEDRRVPIDRINSPLGQALNAVGVISLPEYPNHPYEATGFLVSRCHVLTNFHVVYPDAKTKGIEKNKRVNFSVGQPASPNKSRDKSASFQFVDVSGTVIAARNDDNNATDWAVIKLDQRIGETIKPLPILQIARPSMYISDNDGRPLKLVTAGFPADKTRMGQNLSRLWGDVNCMSWGLGHLGDLQVTCQSKSGQSGSPIIYESEEETYYALGMIAGIKYISEDLAASNNGLSGKITSGPSFVTHRVDLSTISSDINPTLIVNPELDQGNDVSKRFGSDGDDIRQAIQDNKCN